MHAERVAGDPQAVRWVMPAGRLPVGRVRRAPGELGAMFDAGTLTAGLVEHTALWLWVSADTSWAAHGRAVQSALRAALEHPDRWVIEPAPGEVLARVTADLLDGPVGDFVRSHGGSARTELSGDGTVAVHLGGACEHCPAADLTLRQRLMNELRRRCPDVVEVDRGPKRLVLALGAERS